MTREQWENKAKILMEEYIEDIDEELSGPELEEALSTILDMCTNAVDDIRTADEEVRQAVTNNAIDELAELLSELNSLGSWYFGFCDSTDEQVKSYAKVLVSDAFDDAKFCHDAVERTSFMEYLMN